MLIALQQLWMVFDAEHWDFILIFLRASNGMSHKHKESKLNQLLRLEVYRVLLRWEVNSLMALVLLATITVIVLLFVTSFFVLLSAPPTAGEEKSSDCVEQGVFCNRRGSVSDHRQCPGLLSTNLLAWCGTGEETYVNAITEWQRTVRPQHLIIKINWLSDLFLMHHITR